MRELDCNEINAVDGGSGGEVAAGVVKGGASGAVAGLGLGAAVGSVIGGPPGAAVLGLAGAGIGFVTGMVAHAFQ